MNRNVPAALRLLPKHPQKPVIYLAGKIRRSLAIGEGHSERSAQGSTIATGKNRAPSNAGA